MGLSHFPVAGLFILWMLDARGGVLLAEVCLPEPNSSLAIPTGATHPD